MRRLKLFPAILTVGLGLSEAAFAQSAPTTSTPPVPPAPTTASPPPAATTAAPAPAASPAAPATPTTVAVPPGYKLVRVDEPQESTRHDVQYPQRRGALPPGMELPYEEGDPIPPGYRLREQKRRGLIIAGSIVTGIPWMISLTAATGADFENKSGYLIVPGIGPWLMLLAGGASDRSCGSDSVLCEESRAGLRAALVLDGLVQSAGAAMFAAGFLFPRQRLVRQDVTVSIAPTTVAPGAYGLGAVGTF